LKVAPPAAAKATRVIKEKPIVKETREPTVEPDKKEEIIKEIPVVKKEDPDEPIGLDHLKKLREEAQSELKFSEKNKQTPVSDEAGEEIPAVEVMEKMNVHQLRKLARSIPNFPIKGRDISKANRGTLLDYLKNF
jgi:hypothetical protein